MVKGYDNDADRTDLLCDICGRNHYVAQVGYNTKVCRECLENINDQTDKDTGDDKLDTDFYLSAGEPCHGQGEKKMNPQKTRIAELSKTLNDEDKDGNQLIFRDKSGTVFLNLVSEGRSRKIGHVIVNRSGRATYAKKTKDEHVFRKTNSWGINDCMIQALQDDDMLVVETESTFYMMPIEKVKKCGDYLWFKATGFERQIFVPLDEFNQEQKR